MDLPKASTMTDSAKIRTHDLWYSALTNSATVAYYLLYIVAYQSYTFQRICKFIKYTRNIMTKKHKFRLSLKQLLATP